MLIIVLYAALTHLANSVIQDHLMLRVCNQVSAGKKAANKKKVFLPEAPDIHNKVLQ